VHPRRRWPVPASLLIGIAPVVVFATISAIRARPSDDYSGQGLTTRSVIHSLLLPELITAGAMVVIVSALGWWRIVGRERTKGAPMWAIIAPAGVFLVALLRFPLIDWGHQPASYFLLLAPATLLVGVFEELLARGMLIAGLRRRLPEFWVWLLSSLIFGMLHLLNILAGQAVGTTILQVVFAASFGSALYIARRLTRTIVTPIIMHAVWDFGALAFVATVPGASVIGGLPTADLALLALLGLGTFGILLFSVIAGVFVALHDDRGRRSARRWRTVPALATYAVRAAEPSLQTGWEHTPRW
jgi:membrane protease YdiL (CAAX protease family)